MQALVRVVEAGHLGGVGLDVHWVEPADPSDPLYQFPCVLPLPHNAGGSIEVLHAMANIVAKNIVAAKEGKELAHRLT